MKKLLQQELAAGIPIKIGSNDHKLAFPIGAVILYKQLTGDSLFKFTSWIKPGKDGQMADALFLIGPDEDPEKFQFALYAGIYGGQLLAGYRGDPDKEVLNDIRTKVDHRNSVDLEAALVQSLLIWMVPSKSEEDHDQVPTTAAIAS